MTEGSIQLRQYLRLRRAGCPTESAAAQAGFTLAEARLTDTDEARGLLAHIDTTETPHPGNLQPTAPAAVEEAALRDGRHVNAGWDGVDIDPAKDGPGAPTPEENDMARGKRKVEQVEEVQKPDFDLARRIYLHDIKPSRSKQAEHGQELSTAFKAIKKDAHIQPQAAKLAFQLIEMEESKRDDYLRSLRGLLTIFRIFIPADLVDQAEGRTDDNVIPIGEASRPQLATIPGDDGDLAGDDETTWRAGLKEGASVMVPSDTEGGAPEPGVISFVDGDNLDVDVGTGDKAETVTLPRADVLRPQADEQLQAAE